MYSVPGTRPWSATSSTTVVSVPVDQLVAVGLVGGGGADVQEVDGLVLVADVGVDGDLDALAEEGLESHNVLARE